MHEASLAHTSMHFFNLEELVPNGRITVFEGYLVAVETVMLVTGKNRDMAGYVLRNIPEEQFASIKFIERKMPGKGNGRAKLLTFEDTIELIMVLPGKIAKEFRLKFVDIIKRYLAGDHSLIQEIQANARSDEPIHQMARDALDPDNTSLKRKCEELDIAERIQKLEDSRENTRAKAVETTSKALQNIKTLQEILGSDGIDERTRMQIEDYTKNLVLTRVNTAVLPISNSASIPNETDSINVAIVAAEMGFKCNDAEAKLIGKKMAASYREKYGTNPPKHKQYVKGSFIPVNSYMERDRTMMVDIIREVME